MIKYESFISQNTSPPNTKRISIYNSNNKKVGSIRLGNLEKIRGKKLYSFGAISDIHLFSDEDENQYNRKDADTDFVRALTYLDVSRVAFTCICGDITQNGSPEQFANYNNLISNNAKTDIYAITGNHDTYTHGANIETQIASYTGNPLYYYFNHENDVFIMLGIKSEYELFTNDELTWLQGVLEANKDKRCFVFQHCFTGVGTERTCGNANGMYHNQCWVNSAGKVTTQLQAFKDILSQHSNTVFFHGHSHLKFRLQDSCDYANYDESEGFKSVHIPSISVPRVEDGSDEGDSPDYDTSGSEGYVVDVYENGVHLRGRDFIKGEFLPIASYWIDTSFIETNTTAKLGKAKLGTMKLGVD